MIRLFVVLFLSQFFCASNVLADESSSAVRTFLASRQILDVIYFHDSSKFLSNSDKEKIRKCLEVLNNNESKRLVFRLEGFSAEGDSLEKRENRAFFLAKRVADYLRLRDIYRDKIYITGFPGNDGAKLHFNSRVELVVYENLLNFDDAEVEKYILDMTSHSSHE